MRLSNLQMNPEEAVVVTTGLPEVYRTPMPVNTNPSEKQLGAYFGDWTIYIPEAHPWRVVDNKVQIIYLSFLAPSLYRTGWKTAGDMYVSNYEDANDGARNDDNLTYTTTAANFQYAENVSQIIPATTRSEVSEKPPVLIEGTTYNHSTKTITFGPTLGAIAGIDATGIRTGTTTKTIIGISRLKKRDHHRIVGMRVTGSDGKPKDYIGYLTGGSGSNGIVEWLPGSTNMPTANMNGVGLWFKRDQNSWLPRVSKEDLLAITETNANGFTAGVWWVDGYSLWGKPYAAAPIPPYGADDALVGDVFQEAIPGMQWYQEAIGKAAFSNEMYNLYGGGGSPMHAMGIYRHLIARSRGTKFVSTDPDWKYLDATTQALAATRNIGVLKPNAANSKTYSELIAPSNPNVKYVISLGGWSFSDFFSAITRNTVLRGQMINAIVSFIKRWKLDGVDIDWEFQGGINRWMVNGLPDGASAHPDDWKYWHLFVKELRAAFTAQLPAANPNFTTATPYLITTAISASPDTFLYCYDQDNAEKVAWVTANVGNPWWFYLDKINIMTYDFFGGFSQYTHYNSPLFPDHRWPNLVPVPGAVATGTTGGISADEMKKLKSYWNTHGAAELYRVHGVPASKIAIGAAFYGRGVWKVTGPDGAGNSTSSTLDYGLYETHGNSRGVVPGYSNVTSPPGTYSIIDPMAPGEKGYTDFWNVEQNYLRTGTPDPLLSHGAPEFAAIKAAGAAMTPPRKFNRVWNNNVVGVSFSGDAGGTDNIWWGTHDDPETMVWRGDYAYAYDYDTFFWQLSGDDTGITSAPLGRTEQPATMGGRGKLVNTLKSSMNFGLTFKPKLHGWYTALIDDYLLEGVANTNLVWKDRSINGRNLASATGKRAERLYSLVNNKTGAKFTNDDQKITGAAGYPTATNYSFLVALNVPTTVAADQVIVKSSTNVELVLTTTKTLRFTKEGVSVTTPAITTSHFYALITVTGTAATIKVYPVSTTAVTTSGTVGSGNSTGALEVGSNGLELAEVVFFNTNTFTTAEQELLDWYMWAKYIYNVPGTVVLPYTPAHNSAEAGVTGAPPPVGGGGGIGTTATGSYLGTPKFFAASGKNSAITLSWETPPSPVYKYQIYAQEGVGGTMNLLADVLGTVTNYQHTVVNGVTWFYKIRAITASAQGDFSYTAEAKGLNFAATSAPSTPVSNQLTDGTGGASGNDFTLTSNLWNGYAATDYSLVENGRIILTKPVAVVPGTDQFQAQQINVAFTDKPYGGYEYYFIVRSPAGTSIGPKTVKSSQYGSKVVLQEIDYPKQSVSDKVPVGTRTYTLYAAGVAGTPAYTVVSSRPSVVTGSVANGILTVTTLKPGRGSLKIVETTSGNVRLMGFRVMNSSGVVPLWPDHVPIGTVGEDYATDLAFLAQYNTDLNKNITADVRYIYMGYGAGSQVDHPGTINEQPGGRMRRFIRESRMRGMTVSFTWYNIMRGGGESYSLAKSNLQSASAMVDYYTDAKKFIDHINDESPDDPVWVVVEPDFLGYFAQNKYRETTPIDPNTFSAQVSAAYTAGVLSMTNDPVFPNTLKGFVQSLTYIFKKYGGTNVKVGWKYNLWAMPSGPAAPAVNALGGGTGWTCPSPSTGLMHVTDAGTGGTTGKYGWDVGRTKLYEELKAISQWYLDCGVNETVGTTIGSTTGLPGYKADFLAMDKYGLDAGSAGVMWMFNGDHWKNYLMFAQIMSWKANLPMMLWQLPVGHQNTTTDVSPFTGSIFPNSPSEDTTPDYFLGHKFTPTANLALLAENNSGDPKLTVSGPTYTWGQHITEAQNAGIIALLFGAGVPSSVTGTPQAGTEPSDSRWWISKVQKYYQTPVARTEWVNPGDPMVFSFPVAKTYTGGTGILKPSTSQVVMNNDVITAYNAWKGAYLKPHPKDSSIYYVDTSTDTAPKVTVSEATGYGMMIAAFMNGYDANARVYFDGLWKYYKRYPSAGNPLLGAWAQRLNATTGDFFSSSVDGITSAMDGDMDVAYALLMADKIWGSGGAINYKAKAVELLGAMRQSVTHLTHNYLKLGDWAIDNSNVDSAGRFYSSYIRQSDFMPVNLRAFATVDPIWETIRQNHWTIFQYLMTNYSPQYGLMPDFAFATNANATTWGRTPDGTILLEKTTDGQYQMNSSRVPWRITQEYLFHGGNAKIFTDKINSWLASKLTVSYTVSNIKAGVDTLTGNFLVGAAYNPEYNYNHMAFTGSFMVGAMLSGNQAMLDALYNNVRNSTVSARYFEQTLKVLYLITVTGNWWNPY